MTKQQEREHILSEGCWCKPIILSVRQPHVTMRPARRIVKAEQVVFCGSPEEGYDAGWRVHIEPEEQE